MRDLIVHSYTIVLAIDTCLDSRKIRPYHTRGRWAVIWSFSKVWYKKKKTRAIEKTGARKMSGSFGDKLSRHNMITSREGRDEERNKGRTERFLPYAGQDYDFCGTVSSASSSLESTASLMSEIVLSRLRRLVLGLVMVVPRLAVLPWPRLDGGPIAGNVEPGAGNVEPGVGNVGDPPPEAMTRSRAAETPLAGTGDAVSSDGDGGFDIIARPSVEFASYSSGGRRSFSISDLRLKNGVSVCWWCIDAFQHTRRRSS